MLQLLQLLPGLVQGGPGLLPGLVQMGLSGQTAAAETGERIGPLPFQGADGLLQAGDLPAQGGQRFRLLLHLGQLLLQLGDLAHALVHPAAVEPLPQAGLGLGKGHVLLAGGDQGGDAPLQLWGGGDGQVSPAAQEGGALKYLPAHAGEQLPAGVGGETGYRLLRPGVHGGEGGEGCAVFGAPADGDIPAPPLHLQLPGHGGPGPGLIAVFLRQMALPVPLPGVEAVEHGLPEGAPGGFSPLIGGADQVQTVPQLQPGPVQLAEDGGHGSDFHGQMSSPFSSAARPKRAARRQTGSSGRLAQSCSISRRNSPVRLSSSRRCHRSWGSRVSSRTVRP